METTTSAALSQNGPLANRQEPDNTILAGHSANFIVPDELDEYNPAAGMDFTARPKVEDVPTSVHEMAISDAAWQETLARQKEQDEYDWGDVAKDSFSTSLPGALARIAGDAIYGTPDDGPNLTPLSEQSFDERLKLAQQMGLAESAIWELQDARTEEEFDFLINRANEFQQARDRLMSNGWGAFAVDFLIQNFNPAELALGYGVVSPLRRLMKGADYSRKALAAGTGLAGATALTTSMAIQDYSGGAPSLGEYIFAAGLGASLGAALGPLGYSPMSAAERKAMADAATRYVKLGEEVMQREVAAMAAADAPSSTASVKAAEAATTKVAEAPAPAPVKPTADTAAEVVASLQRRLEDIDEELTYAERNNDDGTLASTIDELRQEAIDIEARIGMLSEEPAPVVPQTKMVDPPEMEATPQMLKSKSFVGAYEGPEPGSYYRIDATQKGDDGFFDMSGPFRVVKIDASGNVTRLADEAATMADAKAIIPKREVAEEVAAPLPTEGGDTALAARIFDQIDALREFDPELADTLAELRDQLIPSTADDLTPAPQSAGAAATPETSLPPDLDFIRNQAVRWIKNEDVAYSRFANVRPDRAAFTLKSDNPLSRLLTRHVMDDVVGRRDHGTNPFSADLDGEQILGKLTAPYLQARKNLWHEYAKAMAIPRHTWHFKAGEFYNRAGEFMSGKPLPDDMPQAAKNAIKKLADVQAEQFELARKLAQNPLYRPGVPDEMQRIARPLPNAVNLKPPSAGTYYFPRKYSSKKVALEVSRRDGKFLSRIFTDAIRKAQPGLQDHYVKALGAGMAKNIRNRAFGLGDDWTIAFADGDRARFIELLGRDTGLSPGEIEEIAMKMFDGKAPDPGDVMGNFKHRVMLDENHVDDATGVAIMDLMDKNADDAFLAYMTRLSGRLALSRMVVKAPQVPRFRSIRKPDGTEELIPDGFHGGETLLDGVRTDADLQGYFRSMAEWAAQHGDELLRSQTQVDINRLQFAVDRILKRPLDTQGTKFAQIMRNIRDYQFTRLMWSVPISMMNEFVLPVATLGVKAGFKHMPSMRRVIDDAGRQRLKSPLFDEIEHMGIGYEHLHNVTFRSADNFADDQAALINGSFHEKLTDWLHYGTKLTGHYSGMTNVQAFSERLAASAAFQKIANMAADYKPGHAFIGDDLKRWRQLGLSDEMMVRVFDNFKHVDHVDSIYFPGSGKKITRLNFHKWDDPEAAEAVEQAVFRLSRKLIQKQSVGNTAIWMSDPLHQSLWQFRNFSFTALPNHTLYNLHMRDAAAVRTLVWSTTWAATVRAMQVKLIAAQRPDGAEYEAKHGTPWALAKAGFSRSGYASVSPMFIDSLLRMLGQPGAFEARSTGQASDVFGGIPFVSSYNSIVEGMGGVFGSLIDDRQISQAELRALGSLIPGFTQPMTGILSQLVADRPKRAPRKKADW